MKKLLFAIVLLLALAVPVAAGEPPGNNGTVKVHDGPDEPDPITLNDPKVCTFHLHFFFADPEQYGAWWIKSWPPTGDKSIVLEGTYDTSGDGEDRQPADGAYSVPDGHYKLFWQGDDDTTTVQMIKHKVFRVECQPVATPTPSPTPAATATASSTPAGTPDQPRGGTPPPVVPDVPDSAMPGPSSLPLFAVVLLAALAALAAVNIASRRH